jgi:hypothetical protein
MYIILTYTHLQAILNFYVYFTINRRAGLKEGSTTCNKYGPFICTMVAAPLVLADQVRHVTQDLGWWPEGAWPGSSQYVDNCGSETMACLSAVGWIFTVVLTYTGFIFIAVGTLWNANMIDKCKLIRKKWAELRTQRVKSKADETRSVNHDANLKEALLVNKANEAEATAP